MKIADLIKDPTEAQWEKVPEIPGFEVLVRLPDILQDTRLIMRALPEDQVKLQKESWADYHHSVLKYAVADWRGLTIAGLAKLFPDYELNIEGQDIENSEMAYDEDNLTYLLTKSGVFLRWLNEVVRRRQQKAEHKEEADRKN